MKILSQIIIPRPEGKATIQLLQGDLTAIPKELAVDILAISAFQGSYEPYPGTLMAALHNAGVSVAELAKDKDLNLMDQLSCWISKPLNETQQKSLNFKKILCFEPTGNVQDVQSKVGTLFRGLNTYALDDNNDEVALPVLATGSRQFPFELMLSTLLDTALFWLETGLPLKSMKFVLHTDEQKEKGLPIFENTKKQYELKKRVEAGKMSADNALNQIKTLNQDTPDEYALPKLEYSLVQDQQRPYDFFISYSHKHSASVEEFVREIKAKKPELNIFYDRETIPSGGLWIRMISDAIQNSKKVICILTPEYSKSDVCWDEFQCAYIMQKRKKLDIRMINFCNDMDLPPIIAIYSYIDCTEGDLEKLRKCVDELF